MSILERSVAPTSAMPERRTLRILHLGFENPLMPGAGGGSVRTHEIDRRLAAHGIEVEVLTTCYPGSRARVHDGVLYTPLGYGAGRTRLSRLAGYVVRLPAAVRRRRDVDLVVEDFFAPFSSMGAPSWTGRPTVGMVQWLHAEEKSRQYKLPLHWIERLGVRRHHRLVAVSRGTADKLVALNPAASVEVITNGVSASALVASPRVGRDVVFLGRLDYGPKGLDLLLEAWKTASRRIDGDLLIAGTGPDLARVRQHVERLGLADRVRMLGWIEGQEKVDLLAGARAVVVPSRHETFGMVALEALAAGTPVVCFAIPGLDEVVSSETGRLVAPFDIGALSDAIVDVYDDQAWLLAAGQRGQQVARGYQWDEMARRQAEVYRDAVDQASAI